MERTLMVALVGMVVVFIVLVLIILCIKLYSGIVRGGGKKRSTKGAAVNDTNPEPQETLPVSEISSAVTDDTEIIAVITAAIMACMQGSGTGLRVRSIRRIGHTTPIWNVTGRNEQVLSKI